MSSLIKLILKRFRILRPEWFFAAVALPYGLALLIVTPPFQEPDSFVHFCRAYQVSGMQVVAQKQGDFIGGEIPFSLINLISHYNFFQLNKNKQDLNVLKQQFKTDLNADERIFVDFRSSAFYSPVLYFPQATGIAVARLFGGGPLLLFYAGRLGNLLVYILLAFLAIRLMPAQAWTLTLVALMPMTMFLAASVSADGMAISTSFLFIAAVFVCISGAESGRKFSPWWLLVLSVMMGLCKGYLPILLLVFAVSPSLFENRWKHAVWTAGVITVGVGALALWGFVTHHIIAPAQPGFSPGTQLLTLIHQPGKVVGLIFATWSDYIFVGALAKGFVGKLGWLEVTLPFFLVLMYIAFLFGVSLFEAPEKTFRLNGWKKSLCAGIVITTVLLISMWLFITFTPTEGAKSVHGIQGRYFISVAPLFFMMFLNEKGGKFFANLKPWMCGFVVLSAFITIHTLWAYYYVCV